MNSLYNIIGRAVVTIIQLVYIPLLYNTLGENQYGIYAIAFIIFLNVQILDFGIGKATIRLFSIYNEVEKQKLFYSLFFLVLLIFVFFSSIFYIIFKVIEYNVYDSSIFLIASIWGLLEIIKMFLIGVQLFYEKFLEYNIVIATSEMIKLIIVILMSIYEFDLLNLIFFFSITSLLQILYYLLRFKFTLIKSFKIEYCSFKFIIDNFSVFKNLTLSNLLLKANFTIDKLAVWFVGSNEILARYYLSMQVISKAVEFPQNIMIGFNSKIAIFSNKKNSSPKSGPELVKESLVYSIFFVFLGIIIFELVGNIILPLILTEYNEDIYSYISLLFYSVPYTIITLQTMNVINMAGKLVKILHIQSIQIISMLIGISLIGNNLNINYLIDLFILSSFLVSLFASFQLVKWNRQLKNFLIKIYLAVASIQLCISLLI